jgi:5,5'-dehydrodivanillate O-demethylase oxygenase subunit
MSMLSNDDNTRLTQVEPGTPMGELLRRYWMPIAAVAELDDRPTKSVRLLGEDLVLYRDKGGRYGLIDRQCPHRCADLSYGMVEECGLRCSYHGWLFNEEGRCIAQPFEESVNAEARFKERIRMKAYPVQANAGLLWAYLGPAPAPLVPNWRNFQRKGYKHLCFAHLPCNWLQAMENSFDQVHNEWMHDKWSFYERDGSVPSDRWQIKTAIHREFDYGWTAEIEYVGHSSIFPDRVVLFPNYNFIHLFEWYVPIDTHNTLLILWHNVPFRGDAPFTQSRIPYWTGQVRSATTDRFLTRPPRNQDVAIWIGQGRVTDRTQEHLGLSDAGIIMFRKKLMEQIAVVERGGEPKAVIRDPQKYAVMLPEPVPSGPERDGLPGALAAPSDIRTVGYLAGFPDELARELDEISQQRGEYALRVRELKAQGWKSGGKDFNRELHFGELKRHGLVDDECRAEAATR